MTSTNEGPNQPIDKEIEPTPSFRTRRFAMLGAGVVIFGLLCIGIIPRLILQNRLVNQKNRQRNAIPSVFVTPAQPSPATVKVQLSGTMSPITEAPILARVDGYLKKRLVDIGDRVRTGQVLGVIAAPDLDEQVSQAAALVKQSKSNLEQSRAALDQAKANAGIAQITADRWAALVKKGAVSRQANDNYQFAYSAQVAEVGVATASVASAINSVGANTANLEHYQQLQGFEVVRAPYEGVITLRNIDDGALVTATDTLLYRIAKNDQLRTFIDVPQMDAPSIRVGDTADLVFVQYPSRVFHGKVTRTSDSLSLNTRTLLTEVDVDNKDGALLPGMYTTVTFELPRTVSSVFVPGEALSFRADGTTVAVVNDQNIVHVRKVTVGHDYGALLEIVSGLEAGERVVVNPNDVTVEGARINPVVVSQAAGSLAPASAASAAETKSGKSQ